MNQHFDTYKKVFFHIVRLINRLSSKGFRRLRALWEYPVALWAGQQASSTFAASSTPDGSLAFGTGGRDDVPLRMAIVSPAYGAKIERGQPFTVLISHSEMENVLGVTYYLNGARVGESRQAPFSYSMTIGSDGPATVRAVAESPLDEAEASVSVTVGSSAPVITRSE